MKYLRLSILFVVLLTQMCAVFGQSVVSMMPEHRSDTTIVRYWQGGISVVYTHTRDDDNWFLLMDSAVSQVRRIVVPPEVTVNDFRIFHDTVFVCGHYMSGTTQMGLLVCFGINDFYSAFGNYRYGLATATPMPDIATLPPVNDLICDILRIAVYDSGGCSKIAFIAKNRIDGESNIRVGVGCARYDGTGWDGMFLYNKYGIEEYTDIIATQNYVVAVARTNNMARLALRIYPKSDFLYSLGGYPIDVFYPNQYGQELADLEVDDNVMAAALDNDEFALAYHYTNSPNDGLAVRMFNIVGGLATLTQGVNAPITRQLGSTWKMRDVRRSTQLMHLVVLNDIDGGTIGSQTSIIYHFQLPSLSTGFYSGRYLSGYNLHALDTYLSEYEEFVVSGNKAGGDFLTLYWEPIGFFVSCGLQDVIRVDRASPTLYATFMQTNLNKPIIINGSMAFAVEEIERDVICNQ